MAERSALVTAIVLAGGEATRFPGKLYMDAGDLPLIVRVYRNVSDGRATLISCKGALPYEIDLLIDAPAVVDRWPMRGPLSGLLSTISEVHTPWVFAAAGDAPFLDAALIDRLEACIEPGDEAIVPRRMRDGEPQFEPLAALYHAEAFMREGLPVLLGGRGSLRAVIEGLRTRYVDMGDADEKIFTNVNTPDDYASYVIPSLSRDR
jgi:molybdopterin-guanine dinucleotide biosynthesis protein A